jgi:Lysylphosphatidylglycerol synthase TM region
MTAPATPSPRAAWAAAEHRARATARGARGLRRWMAALAVSTGILVYLFATQGVHPGALVPLIGAIWLPGLVGYATASAAALLLRALRYRLLLGRPVAFWPLVLVTAVRNMAVDLVPARAGAAASYLYLVTARLGLPIEAAVASFAASFILDTLAVAPLLVLAVLAVGSTPLPPVVLVAGSLLVLACSVIALWVLAPLLRGGAVVAGRLPRLGARLAPLLRGAAVEVQRLEHARTLVPALGLSLLLRLAKYGAYYCLLQALLVSQGQPWGSLSFVRVFLSVAGAELAASLPLPTLASVGPYEVVGAAGFAFWLGLSRELATLAVTAFHALSQIHDYGLGLLALLWIMAPWAGRRGAPDIDQARVGEGDTRS